MTIAAAQLPVRRYAENHNGTYWKINEKFNVIHCVQGDRLCCIDCRSNTCEHVRAVEACLTRELYG